MAGMQVFMDTVSLERSPIKMKERTSHLVLPVISGMKTAVPIMHRQGSIVHLQVRLLVRIL